MTLDQLECFVAVARTGHFTRAAREIHLSQPSLSRQIATLEHDLGAVLFDRARGNVTLSAAGEALFPVATRMLEDADGARRAVADIAGLRTGRLRLGATPSLCISVVAELLERYHRSYPGVELHVVENGSRVLVDRLARGELDTALVIDAADGRTAAGLESRALYHEELVVVSAADRPPLTRRPALRLADLAKHPMVVFDQSYDLRTATDAAFKAAGLHPIVAIEGGELDAVLRFVERGIGSAVVPSTAVFSRPGLRAVRLTEPVLRRTVCLAHRSNVRSTRATMALEGLLAEVVGELTAGDYQGVARAD
ncbi:MAG: LysR family transcriptional regulator [Rhodococcus sp.]|nr:LysR family transcriptional regulator [Rhodococcus sp. (in: high G+C Gram-positive bacteria)]